MTCTGLTMPSTRCWSFITQMKHTPHCSMTGTILIETLYFLPLMTTKSSAGSLYKLARICRQVGRQAGRQAGRQVGRDTVTHINQRVQGQHNQRVQGQRNRLLLFEQMNILDREFTSIQTQISQLLSHVEQVHKYYISPYPSVSIRIHPYPSVSVCLCPYLYDSVRLRPSPSVSVRLPPFTFLTYLTEHTSNCDRYWLFNTPLKPEFLYLETGL